MRHSARQRWPGHPISVSQAHKAVVSYGVLFQMKVHKGGITDVGLIVINGFQL